MRADRLCICDRRADLWLRNAEERGKRHAGQSRGDVYTESTPSVFRFDWLYPKKFVLYKSVESRGWCSLERADNQEREASRKEGLDALSAPGGAVAFAPAACRTLSPISLP